MIYSKKLQTPINVTVQKKEYDLHNFGRFTKYIVKDDKVSIGYVDVKDTSDGIYVEFIKNEQPELYSGFGKLADRIEVEHCMNRGLTKFNITSDAALNSHALHFLRGKRFKNPVINKKVEEIIKQTPKGENFYTKLLGKVEMYMPKKVIKEHMKSILETPILK